MPHNFRVTTTYTIMLQLPRPLSAFKATKAALWLPMALSLVAPLAAQINYATPYTFAAFAGAPSMSGSVDGTGTAARFNQPYGLALDSSGNLFVADKNNQVIRKVTAAGVVTTLAGSDGSSGTTDGTGTTAQFNQPTSVAVDGSGNVFVADSHNNVVRKVTSSGTVSTFAGTAGSSGSTDGSGTSVLFNQPWGIAVDSTGNVYVSEFANHTIRKITSSGTSSTLAGTAGVIGYVDGTGTAAEFNEPVGIAIDSSGNIYVADSGNNAIRKVTSAGVVTTLAGGGAAGSADGIGKGAQFHSPRGVAVDSSGNVYVADSQNGTVRKITPAGVVTTLAGSPGSFAIQAGTGASALLDTPTGIAVDGTGKVYVSDALGYTIELGTAATAVAPAFTLQPASQTVATGSTVVFRASAGGIPAATYQWYLNNVALTDGALTSGSTGPTLMLRGTTAASAGAYTCTATNASGTVTSNPALLTLNPTVNSGRLINFSCRSQVQTGANILIAGFVVGYNTPPTGAAPTTEPVLVRASGPALAAFNITGFLPDPGLQLLSGSTVIGSDSGWAGSAQIAAAATAVAAFPWTNTASLDSALVATVPVGAYTAQVSGASGDTGISLVEVYDAGEVGFTSSNPELLNISTRTQVGTGANVLISGFVIGGTTAKTVLVRASGPALSQFGITGTLADPKLEIFSGSTPVATNVGWGGDPQVALAAAVVGAFAWSSSTSADSAILITLPPGPYTAEVSGASVDTGVALIEVYAVP